MIWFWKLYLFTEQVPMFLFYKLFIFIACMCCDKVSFIGITNEPLLVDFWEGRWIIWLSFGFVGES